jgi:hypothetical protein
MGEVVKRSGGSVTRKGGHPVRWVVSGFAFWGIIFTDGKYFHLVHHMFGSVSPLISLVLVLAGLGMIIWGAVTRR